MTLYINTCSIQYVAPQNKPLVIYEMLLCSTAKAVHQSYASSGALILLQPTQITIIAQSTLYELLHIQVTLADY